MSDTLIQRRMPNAALAAAAALVILSFGVITTSRVSGVGKVHAAEPVAVQSRVLRFEDRPNGAIAVSDVTQKSLVGVIEPGTYGFVRVALRGMARDRFREGIGGDQPFVLARASDGRLILDDPTTGRNINLGAFGKVNAQAFARLLDAKGTVQ